MVKERAAFTAGAKQGVQAAGASKTPDFQKAFRQRFLKTGEGRAVVCVCVWGLVCDQFVDFLLTGWW